MNPLDKLRALSQAFITNKYETYERYFIRTTPLYHRFIIILGERGVGKTTTIIQHLLAMAENKLSNDILYVQADHFIVQQWTLYEIADSFVKFGGKIIAFDEIHKYPNWSMELKSIYDTFPQLKIIASGSSVLAVSQGTHDLSRRAITYRMVGLSFREYLELKYQLTLPSLDLESIVKHHVQHTLAILQELNAHALKILKVFNEYLQYGYYPYFREFVALEEFKISLEQNIHTTIESDLVAIYPHLTGNSVYKIKQLLAYIAQSVPFTAHWQKIKNITAIGDDRTLKTYFKYLVDGAIIRTLAAHTNKLKRLEVSEKIFLGNTNQLYALTSSPDRGTVRETFFLSMLAQRHSIANPKNTDFYVNKLYFEIGGKGKNAKQIYDVNNSYLAVDDIEQGAGKSIPLWIFGFLY